MPIGTKLRCKMVTHPNSGIEEGREYTFLGYDENQVPKNKQNAVMTWYPDAPIWTPEEYEYIREKFMMVNLEGVEGPQWLSNFDIIS